MNSAPLPPPLMSALALLGGEAVLHAHPRASMDWIPLVRQGLPSASVDAAVRLTQITHAQLAQALAIAPRTLARRKRAGALAPEESAKLRDEDYQLAYAVDIIKGLTAIAGDQP